jgi:hypothetical protein
MAATKDPSPSFIFDASSFVVLTKGTSCSKREPGRPMPATDSWGAAVPRFGSMADVAMEIWGKAAGGREAAAHLVFVCCVCVLSVCAMFCTCQFLGLYPVDFFVRQS